MIPLTNEGREIPKVDRNTSALSNAESLKSADAIPKSKPKKVANNMAEMANQNVPTAYSGIMAFTDLPD